MVIFNSYVKLPGRVCHFVIAIQSNGAQIKTSLRRKMAPRVCGGHILVGGLEHEFYFPIYWE